ncbi:MAG: hypothetical protein KF916_07060 [Microbacteriaceae bacterium]|nr:hypothetical protein [Microbacteriaceae bacterium]
MHKLKFSKLVVACGFASLMFLSSCAPIMQPMQNRYYYISEYSDGKLLANIEGYLYWSEYGCLTLRSIGDLGDFFVNLPYGSIVSEESIEFPSGYHYEIGDFFSGGGAYGEHRNYIAERLGVPEECVPGGVVGIHIADGPALMEYMPDFKMKVSIGNNGAETTYFAVRTTVYDVMDAQISGLIAQNEFGCLGISLSGGDFIPVIWPNGSSVSNRILNIPGVASDAKIGDEISLAGGFVTNEDYTILSWACFVENYLIWVA